MWLKGVVLQPSCRVLVESHAASHATERRDSCQRLFCYAVCCNWRRFTHVISVSYICIESSQGVRIGLTNDECGSNFRRSNFFTNSVSEKKFESLLNIHRWLWRFNFCVITLGISCRNESFHDFRLKKFVRKLTFQAPNPRSTFHTALKYFQGVCSVPPCSIQWAQKAFTGSQYYCDRGESRAKGTELWIAKQSNVCHVNLSW